MDLFNFRPKKAKRTPPPKPAWLKWLLLAFIGYILVVANMPGNNATRQAVEKAKANIEQTKAENFTGYKDKIFPEHAAGLRINDTVQGEGMPAVCGQRVTIAYDAFLAQGNAIADKATKEKPLSFTIGDGHAMPVFDRGVIGMKVGGKRSILAPPLMSYGIDDFKRDDVPKGANIRMEMELLSIEPKIPDVNDVPYRIADIVPGTGMQVACGQASDFRIQIWSLNGKEIFSNHKDKEPLTIIPGKGEYMLGLEQGVMGMLEGGRRLLIIPPAYEKTMDGKVPAHNFPLPKDETVMVEVIALSH